MKKIIHSAFEKVIIKTAELMQSSEIEKEDLRIEDEDGTIIAFSNGTVLLNDGYWYERQYAALDKIFANERNRKLWLSFLEDIIGPNCDEMEKFNEWIFDKGKRPISITYTAITQTGIEALSEHRIDDEPPVAKRNNFDKIRVYVLPIDEVNLFITKDTTGRFDKEESAANIDKLTYTDCRRILGRYTDKTTNDRIADCYTLEEFENEINFSVEESFDNNYYIKFVQKP